MVFWIKFREKVILDYKERLDWKGSGSKDDPIIIDSLEGLKRCLRFKKIKSHLVLRNLELCELMVNSCQNIIIDNCDIYYFSIEFCHNLRIENSSIVNLNMEFSKENTIKNCKLHETSSWSNITLETNGEKGVKLIFGMNICWAIFFLFLSIIILYSRYPDIAFISIAGFLVFLIPALRFQIKRILFRKYSANVFENTEFADLSELDEKYSAVYDI